MERKFKFNKKGIHDLQQSLHTLPDAKLAIEVLVLRSDFQNWVKNKFDLTNDDLDLIDKMDRIFIGYAAIKASNYLAKRLSINFSIIEFNGTQAKIIQP